MENAMKHIHRTRGDRIFDAINVAALCLLLAVILYPLIYVLSCSFSDPLLVVQSKITFLPMQPTLVAYQRVFRNELIMTGYQNTLFYTLLGTALNVAVTTMMAYPLSRHDFAARRPITMLTAFTMLFSGGMIPTYLVMKDYGLINSIWSMILPWAVSSYYVIIMKNYFRSISPSLEEAAVIDGAGDLQILVRIILPISLPFTMTFLLFYAVERWNEWWNAYLYINEKSLYPLQIYLREVLINMNNQLSLMAQITSGKKIPAQSVQMGTIVITALPILCVYPFVQKYFVKGVMIGSIKE